MIKQNITRFKCFLGYHQWVNFSLRRSLIGKGEGKDKYRCCEHCGCLQIYSDIPLFGGFDRNEWYDKNQ